MLKRISKTFKQRLWLFILLALLLTQTIPAAAHPADLILQKINLRFTADQIILDWEISPDPTMVYTIRAEADQNEDELISEAEARAYITRKIPFLESSWSTGDTIEWQLESLDWPENMEELGLGKDSIQVQLKTDLPPSNRLPLTFNIENSFEKTFSINWFTIDAEEKYRFSNISQEGNFLSFELSQSASETAGIQHWDSATPDLVSFGSTDVQGTQPEEKEDIQSRLSALLQRAAEDRSAGFIAGALAVSFVLGALHAFTPGHGKSVVAAYMVGSKGTWVQSIVLGLVIALTHTGTVILSGVLILLASNFFMPQTLFPLFELLSGLIIALIGGVLIVQRSRFMLERRKEQQKPKPEPIIIDNPAEEGGESRSARVIIQQPIGEDAPPHPHIGPKYVPKDYKPSTSRLEWRTLLALGTSGGLVPCPDAVAILIIGSASGQSLFSGLLIFAFSLGIAAVLMAIGFSILKGAQLFSRFSFFESFTPYAPLLSSAVVLVLGIVLLTTSWNRYQPEIQNFSANLGIRTSAQEPPDSILYKDTTENFLYQIYQLDLEMDSSDKLTDEAGGVIDFVLGAQDNTVYYSAMEADNSLSRIMQLDLETRQSELIFSNPHSMIQGLLLSPDQQSLLFENSFLPSEENPGGLTTIWILDLQSGEAQALMNNQDFVCYNPAFSPDMNWFSFTSPGDGQIHVNQINGKGKIEFPTNTGSKIEWAADSESFLYTDYTTGADGYRSRVLKYDLDSGGTLDLTENLGDEGFFAVWNHSSNWIAATIKDRLKTTGTNIWLISPDGKQTLPLTDTNDGFQVRLSWSDDDRYLLYEQIATQKDSAGSGIWMAEQSSGELTQLTESGQNPVWRE